jgi:hypothetical protein
MSKKKLIFKDLVLDENGDYCVAGLFPDKEVICSEFIYNYFGFKKNKDIPKIIKKLTIVKEDKGFVNLSIFFGMDTYTLEDDFELNWSTPTDKVTEKLFSYAVTYISSDLLKLFNKNEEEIYVDVYIEYEEYV